MLTYTPNKTKGRVMLPIFMEKIVTENSLAVPYLKRLLEGYVDI